MNNRQTHKAVTLLCLTGLCLTGLLPSTAQSVLDPGTQIPYQFMDDLPNPGAIDATMGGRFTMTMRQTTQHLGIRGAAGHLLPTTVWGYGLVQPNGATVTYPGPTFIARKNRAVRVRWINELPANHLLPVDRSLHLATPPSGVPVVTHLHGGHSESASDGLPEAWFTQGFEHKGAHWVKEEYYYQNDQEAATLWYHDHALGVTRLNVYAGLAGFYLLRDENELKLIDRNVLPSGPYEQGIVIQDRMFYNNGELYYPSEGEASGECLIEDPPAFANPSILPEFFGDVILVNARAWPRFRVEPRKYRLRLLNGSDSRFYVLQMSDNTPFLQIGSDLGLLRQAVSRNRLVIGPGERLDVVVDFSGKTGQSITLLNFGPDDPFRGLNSNGTNNDGEGGALPPADPTTTGRIMQFQVVLPHQGGPEATVAAGDFLRIPYKMLKQTGATRQLVLFEALDQFCRLRPQLGTLADGSLLWDEPVTENPGFNDVEVWEIYNATEDAHPIHLHLVSFRILEWEKFEGEAVTTGLDPISGGTKMVLSDAELTGQIRYPGPEEAGWKDTGIVPPGEVMRVIARFDRKGLYAWHCHILSHEDHEMMRPYYVSPSGSNEMKPYPEIPADPVNFPYLSANRLRMGQNQPNPFVDETFINFQLPETTEVQLVVYSIDGRKIKVLADGEHQAGEHRLIWDGRDEAGRRLPPGVYIYQLRAGAELITKRLSLISR